ncbi:MAG: hypothetical protein ACYTEO_17485 [Planctomycetota bacterium]
MSKIESLILWMFFGFLPVLFCVAAAGFINVAFLEEKGIGYWALRGLCVGLIIDVMFVKSLVKRVYQMNSKILAALYIFYSIGVLGFCMGIPILEFPLGMAAGAFAARKMYHTKTGPEEFDRSVKKMSLFAAAVMVLICCLIALWAIAGEMIGYRFETPWLSFTFTVPIFFTVVLTGGAALVLLQYWLTSISAKLAFKLSR